MANATSFCAFCYDLSAKKVTSIHKVVTLSTDLIIREPYSFVIPMVSADFKFG